MSLDGLSLPPLLHELVVAGRWPGTEQQELAQNARPLAPPERIRLLAPEEDRIYLLHPPFFRTVRHRLERGDEFFRCSDAAVWEIDPALAVDIGDFGLGSDAPILLDYRRDPCAPTMLRLKWKGYGGASDNRWVEMAPDFATFVRILGL